MSFPLFLWENVCRDVEMWLLRGHLITGAEVKQGPANKGRFCNTVASVAFFTPLFTAISECRQKKFSQAEIQNKQSHKVALKPVRLTLIWCGRREVLKRRYVLITKEEG